jgi:hypothetical protein
VGIDAVEELVHVKTVLIWQNEETLAVSFFTISLSFKIATSISKKWIQGSLLHALRYSVLFVCYQAALKHFDM